VQQRIALSLVKKWLGHAKIETTDPVPARAVDAMTVDFGIPTSSLIVRAEPFVGVASFR
jgi:hypothetical protein